MPAFAELWKMWSSQCSFFQKLFFFTISALWQTKNCYLVQSRKDTLWNKEVWFHVIVYPSFTWYSQTRPGTRVARVPSASPVPTNPRGALSSRWPEEVAPCWGGRVWWNGTITLSFQAFLLKGQWASSVKLPIFIRLELCVFETSSACWIPLEWIQKSWCWRKGWVVSKMRGK